MFNRIVLFLLLFGTWLILSGFFTILFILLGILSCVLAVFVSRSMRDETEKHFGILGLIFKLISYTIWLMKEIIVSSIDVTIKMWQIEPDISPTVGWIETPLTSDAGITIFGNSITLTPGTVAIDAMSDGRMQVHALTKEGMDSLKNSQMLQKVIGVIGG